MDKKRIGIWYGTIPDDPIKAKEHIEKINKEVKQVLKENISAWFTYKDENGATVSIHIPNLFDRVEELNKKIDNLEAKIAQNRQYTTDRTRGHGRYGIV